jgi:hypothetical protein
MIATTYLMLDIKEKMCDIKIDFIINAEFAEKL